MASLNINHFLIGFMPLMLFSLAVSIQGFLLAREKGRNVVLWTLLPLIPGVNLFCIGYFIGAANHRHEQKLDAILGLLRARQ